MPDASIRKKLRNFSPCASLFFIYQGFILEFIGYRNYIRETVLFRDRYLKITF